MKNFYKLTVFKEHILEYGQGLICHYHYFEWKIDIYYIKGEKQNSTKGACKRFFIIIIFPYCCFGMEFLTLAQLVKLLSCDWKVMGSSPENNLLCKKQGKAAYNTPNGGTPSRTLRMQEL